jgi:hypothetical protein
VLHIRPVPQVTGVNDGGCYGSVLLDNEMWQSLRSRTGGDVPWVHGCVLHHGHKGDHGAPAYQVDGEPQQWLRWPDTGAARLEYVEVSPPGRHSRPAEESDNRPPPWSATAATTAPAEPGPGLGTPATAPPAEALWAIAAAIERLADVLAAHLANVPRERDRHGPSDSPPAPGHYRG